MRDTEENEVEEIEESPRFWLSQIEAAKQAAKMSWDATKEAWEEYLGTKTNTSDSSGQQKAEARYPIYWASIKSIQPMLYSRTPIPVAEKIFDEQDDNLARLSALSAERLAKFLMRACPFDRVMYATRDSYIHGAKTTARVCFEANIESKPERVGVVLTQTQDPQGQPMQVALMPDGNPVSPDAQVQMDEQGAYIERSQDALGSCLVSLVPLHYQDYLHTPNARHHEEIWWMAFRSELRKEEVLQKFGEKIANELSYTVADTEKKTGEDKLQKVRTVSVWEIWNKDKKELYWLVEGGDPKFIQPENYEGGDPYELVGFFPCAPFMLGTCGPDSLYAVPDFVQLKPIIYQLHGMAKRLKSLVLATKKRGVFDNTVTELSRLQDETDEGDFIGINDFKELIGDGGLESIVKLFPTSEIVEAVNQMVMTIQVYEDKYNELHGIPDILRGVTDPNETAAAQQQKGKYLSLRASSTQREFQRLCRDSIELMCDLALKKFPQDKLAQIFGVSRWKPEEQQLFPQVLNLLQNDTERLVRVDIETDSTVTQNEGEELEQANYLARTLLEGLSGLAQVTQQSPQLAPAAMETLLLVIGKTRYGKVIEGGLRQSLQAATQAAMQPPEQGPSPEQMKAEAQMQLEQMKASAKVEIERMQAEADIAVNKMKVEADMARDNIKAQNSMILETKKTENALLLQSQALEGKLLIDRSLAEVQARLKELEFELKAKEQALKALSETMNKQQEDRESEKPEKESQPLIINVDAKQSGTRSMKIRHSDGMESVITAEDAI